MRHPHLLTLSISALAIAAAAALPTMVSAQTTAQSAQQKYQSDVAKCRAGSATQSEADCLYEARSVRRDAVAGKAPVPLTPQELLANALARCEFQPAKDRPACERMARGLGETDGSVAEGGVVKEITTVTVIPAPAAGKN